MSGASIFKLLAEFTKLNLPNPPRTELDRAQLSMLRTRFKLALIEMLKLPVASRPEFTAKTIELITYIFDTKDLRELEGESYTTVHGLFTAAFNAERLKSHGLFPAAPAAGGSRRTRVRPRGGRKVSRRRKLTRRRR